VVVTDCLYRSNAGNAERIRAIIWSNDVSGDDSIDDRTEYNENYVKARKVTRRVQKDDYCCSEVDATGIFIGKEKTKRGELICATHIRCR
jgi:hypothetical protein